MKKIKEKLSFLFLFVSLNVLSQKPSDFSFQLNSQRDSKYQIEFRFATNEKVHIKHGLVFGYPDPYRYEKLIGANDSMGINRVYSGQGVKIDYRLGYDRKLMESRFSYSFDVILGYSMFKEAYFREYNPREDYYGNGNVPYPTIDNNSMGGINRHFLNTGLALGLNYNQPISENISLFCGVNIQSIASIQLGYKELNDYDNIFNTKTVGYLKTTPGLKLGLRFSF